MRTQCTVCLSNVSDIHWIYTPELNVKALGQRNPTVCHPCLHEINEEAPISRRDTLAALLEREALEPL